MTEQDAGCKVGGGIVFAEEEVKIIKQAKDGKIQKEMSALLTQGPRSEGTVQAANKGHCKLAVVDRVRTDVS